MKKLLFFIGTTIALSQNAQVVTAGSTLANYYDVTPDSLLWYRSYPSVFFTYSINVFNSAGYEYMFKSVGSVSSGGSQAYIRIESLRPDMYMLQGRIDSVWCPGCGMGGQWNYRKVAKPLLAGDTINSPTAVWDNTYLYLTEHSGYQGANWNINDFVGGDKYIGLQFRELGNYGTDDRYGWVWVNCISEDSCYVKGYASQARTTGIAENSAGNMRTYPNPVNETFYIENTGGQNFELLSLNITDLYGKHIPFVALFKNDKVELRLVGAANGMYLVNYEKDGLRYTSKIIKAQ
jgi:hypothetical protein